MKRSLLFFDVVHVPDLRDSAIVNTGEVSELFPDGRSIRWGELCPYPRNFSFEDEFRRLQGRVQRVIGTGKLKFIDLRQPSPDDAIKSWLASVGSLKSETLVRAALPDYVIGEEPLNLKVASSYNMVVVGLTDYPSKHLWLTKVDASPVLDISEHWRRLALGRLGRALKAIRHCSLLGSVPLSADPLNQDITLALGGQAFGDIPSPEVLAQSAISLDAVDPVKLDAALDEMTWPEVFKVRKELLPATKKLRGTLKKLARAAARVGTPDLAAYRQELSVLKGEYRDAQEQRGAAWRQIGFRTMETIASSGMAVLATNPAWMKALALLAAKSTAEVLAKSPEQIRTIMLARNARRTSPYFAFDRLEALGTSAAKSPRFPGELTRS